MSRFRMAQRALNDALALLEPLLRQANAEIVRHCPLPEPVALCDTNRQEHGRST